jgi:hypothetical protein
LGTSEGAAIDCDAVAGEKEERGIAGRQLCRHGAELVDERLPAQVLAGDDFEPETAERLGHRAGIVDRFL